MERKLATVLFVDIVGSTAMLAGADPEVARRRVTEFFDHVSGCIEVYGGTVEKFVGDAVMAAFGIPRAHEDDAERALRAALGILAEVEKLGFKARIGVEAGEVVTGEEDSTFATGEAVTLAARLQQAAAPGEILVGRGAHGLASNAIELEPAGTRALRGLAGPVPVWRVVAAGEVGRRAGALEAPLIGRDGELELLENTFERAVRARRPHLFTIYGEPGVGKSRLAREFVAGLEGATVLAGRCLPYGEGITYWPLAEMVKTAAGISDDDPMEEAHEKLLVCCEDEAVADLLALASGVLEAVEAARSQQEIAWAAREWAEQLARAQPLVLAFEDIHWAEQPLIELVDHLASWIRDAPILILCLARTELLDVHPGWGGGRLRATSIELEPLARDDSESLLEALLPDEELSTELRVALLDKTEGNPLFLEETIRMVAQGDGEGLPIPDTLQALIAARIDLLPRTQKLALQRGAVVGRSFWLGALGHLSPELDELDTVVDDLLHREFLLPESRSTISGERAFRFKHVLIREVAYAGLPKRDRAGYHASFAEWLRERAGDELLEIRAYHLDHAASLLAELDGSAPPDLALEAAEALSTAGHRALAREANHAARRLLVRAVELDPTLERRQKAAVAAWRLSDFPAVAVESQQVLEAARDEGNRRIEGRALTALAEVALLRDADLPRARELAEQALDVLEPDDVQARFDANRILSDIGWWTGDLEVAEQFTSEALELARAAGRKDLESVAARGLAQIFITRMQLDRAEPLIQRACELAEESGSIVARAQAISARGHFLSHVGELEEAERAIEEARGLFEEAGDAWSMARALNGLAWISVERGDHDRAEKRFRDAIRLLKPLEDRGALCESQRGLAQVLVVLGRLEEAERMALHARETVGPHDESSRATTRMALALVRAAQGRDGEAEALLREALELLRPTGFKWVKTEITQALVAFLRSRDRAAEADELEQQVPGAPAVRPGQAVRIA